jgi:preprotein translocase subunit SecD
VAGLIIAIGITADSFIVYFERIRDELRVGRPLAQAVDLAWLRARRTIIASDGVNFLAAVVLYLVAVGGVRGFAFTLGLTTVMDLVVVVLFTHPMVLVLSRLSYWAKGRPWSGLDPYRLGAPGAVRYTGRGSFRPLPGAAAASDDVEPAKTESAPVDRSVAKTTTATAERVPGEEGLSIAERKRRAARKAGDNSSPDDNPKGGDA